MVVLSQSLSRDQRIKLATRRLLRGLGLLTDHTPSACDSENIGDTGCRDERYQIEEINHTVELQQRNPLLNSLYGGGMRFSPWCDVPVEWYQKKIAPLFVPGRQVSEAKVRDWDHDELDTAIRGVIKGIVVRGSRLYKLGVHGPSCGWATILGYGLIQQLWLVADGCQALEERAIKCSWGQFRVYGTYHEHYQLDDGQELHRTYAVNRHHSLFAMYPMAVIMKMTDEQFLHREAPDWLRHDDPKLYAELYQS